MNSFNNLTNTTEPIPTIPYNPPVELTYIQDDNSEEDFDPDECIESCICCISWLCGRKNNSTIVGDDINELQNICDLKLHYNHTRELIYRKQQEINILKKELKTVEQYSNIIPYITPKKLGHKCGDNGGVTVNGYPCRQSRSLDSTGRCRDHHHKKH
jgi:hypothetical protein